MTAARPRGLGRLLVRAVQILEEDGYSTDEHLAAELGLDSGGARTVAGILYRQRKVDRAGGYLVLPASKPPGEGRRAA